MKVFVRGLGNVSLSRSDFVAQGGEGSIYAKGDVAYKIYADRARALDAGKLAELARIDDERVIKPETLVMDGAGGPAIGYTMRRVVDAWPLCQLFSRAFKERHDIRPEQLLGVVRELMQRIDSVHAAGALVVDLNEMNFLVSASFDAVYAIDVDSYRTPSFAATAFSPALRDPWTLTHDFDALSDWFSFGVVVAQLLIGVHPFRGKHPQVSAIEERIARHLSFFDPAVRLPRVAYPFDTIPPTLRSWLEATLGRGERLAPPRHFDAASVVTLAQPSGRVAASGAELALVSLALAAGAIRQAWSHAGLWLADDFGLYRDGRRVAAAPPVGAALCFTPSGRAIQVALTPQGLSIHDVAAGVKLAPPAHADALMHHDGRVYLKSDDKIMELVVRDVGSTVIASVRLTARVLPHATRLFDGVAVQSLLGACYLSLFQRSGAHLQLRLRELDGRTAIDAKCDGAVTQLLLRDGAGYQRAWLRLASDGSHDLRLEPTSEATLLPFAALASVYVVLSNDGLEVRPLRPGANGARLVADAAIGGDWRLMHHAGRLLCIAGNEVAAMSLTEPASGTRAVATAL